MKVLITGFDPFGNEHINPSYQAVQLLELEKKEIELVKKELPTVFARSIKVLDRTIKEVKPDIVIATGQAGGRYDISVERVAINLIDAGIPDNDGDQPLDEKIFKDGENAYFSSLPIKAIVKKLREKKIPASVSNSAGTYVCNNLFYAMLYLIDRKYPDIKGGFVHVPYLPEQVLTKRNTPCMSLNDIVTALQIIVATACTTKKDILLIDGKIC
ncbi:MAG: pyroglutamyl-peptidase I [Halanaerobiales bacterium]|nr:pyroglutamyl-peptidase I [Halanaerobiales bacterium]